MTQRKDRWAVVAEAVQSRMTVLGIPDQATLITRSKLSQPTAQLIMSGRGRSDTIRPATAAKLAKALLWPWDWQERIGAGEDLTMWELEDDLDVVWIQEAFDASNARIDRAFSRLDELATGMAELSRRLVWFANQQGVDLTTMPPKDGPASAAR